MSPTLGEEIYLATGPKRYAFSIETIRETGELWIGESDQFTLTWYTEDEKELLPIWPGAEYLQRSLDDDEKRAGFLPVRRDLSDWLKRSTPSLMSEGVLVGVFPNAKRECPVVDARRLARDLTEHLVLQARDLANLGRSVRARKRK